MWVKQELPPSTNAMSDWFSVCVRNKQIDLNSDEMHLKGEIRRVIKSYNYQNK